MSLSSVIQDASYAGKLSADGQSITGTWTQNKQSYALTFAATTPELLWTYGGAKATARMSPDADPTFEVATIKPSAPGAGGRSGSGHTHLFSSKNVTVDDLIKMAYQLRERQIEGEPAWVKDEKFDIQAESNTAGQPSDDQVRSMLKKLLTDRFQLGFHTVQKTFPVYALTLEKSPSGFVKSDPAVNSSARIMPREQANGQMLYAFIYDSMSDFTDVLMNFIPDRQIIDATGLKGPYDFMLQVSKDAIQSENQDERANAVIGAVKGIGMRLDPKRLPVNIMVIDRLERPSPN